MNGGQIILADEPTGALDSHSGAEVIKLLKQLSADGHTIVLITHDPEVAQHAHRRIDISDGRIISDPGPNPGASENANLWNTPAHRPGDHRFAIKGTKAPKPPIR